MWSTATITSAGMSLFANWNNNTLNICKASGGTGTVTSDLLVNLTALSDEKQVASIISVVRDNTVMKVTVQFTAATTSYTLNQIGIFAKINNGSAALLAVFQDSTGLVIPSTGEFLYTFVAGIAINSTSGALTATIDSSAYVSLNTYTTGMAGKEAKITAEGILKKIGDTVSAAVHNVDYLAPDDVGAAAKSNKYTDLLDRPTIPSKTSNLVNDSGFLTGDHNTNENAHGNLWLPGAYFATCTTAENTTVKALTISKFCLKVGCLINVKFTKANTASAPKITINGSAQISIVSINQSTFLSADNWAANEYCHFLYDGTNLVLMAKYTDIPKKSHTHTVNQITDFPEEMTPSEHTHVANDITDFADSVAAHSVQKVNNQSYDNNGNVILDADNVGAIDNSNVKAMTIGTTDLTPGTSALATGTLYIVYE